MFFPKYAYAYKGSDMDMVVNGFCGRAPPVLCRLKVAQGSRNVKTRAFSKWGQKSVVFYVLSWNGCVKTIVFHVVSYGAQMQRSRKRS